MQILTSTDIRARCVAGAIPRVAGRILGRCVIFTGAKNEDGYGQIRHDGSTRLVHRLLYTLEVGPIPAGLTLDHLCRVRACCNPAHMDPVTQRVNIERAKPYWTCNNGHEFTPENTYIETTGRRRCITCRRARTRAAYHAKRQASNSVGAATNAPL